MNDCARSFNKSPTTVRKHYKAGTLDLLPMDQRKVTIEAWGKSFTSQEEAANYKGVAPSVLRYWLDRGVLEDEQRETNYKRGKKRVFEETVNGVTYTDIEEFARIKGVTIAAVYKSRKRKTLDRVGKTKPIYRFEVDGEYYTVKEFAKKHNIPLNRVYKAYNNYKRGLGDMRMALRDRRRTETEKCGTT